MRYDLDRKLLLDVIIDIDFCKHPVERQQIHVVYIQRESFLLKRCSAWMLLVFVHGLSGSTCNVYGQSERHFLLPNEKNAHSSREEDMENTACENIELMLPRDVDSGRCNIDAVFTILHFGIKRLRFAIAELSFVV